MRAQFLPLMVRSLLMLLVVTVVAGLAYPLIATGLSSVAFPDQAQGSLLYRHGRLVGSALLGQNFTDSHGNPLPQYFQPRPSATSPIPYDGEASGASNLGPANPLLVGFIPGVNTYREDGSVAPRNPFATPSDPRCVPLDNQGVPVTVVNPGPGERYERTTTGSRVCDPDTVPERAIAYRQFNGLPGNATIPVDAVTASGSGLDPEISVANALDQAPRVARVRHLPLELVVDLVHQNTEGRQLGFLGEQGVNVLQLNMALEGRR